MWEKKSAGQATIDDILRPGSEQICAGYCMYGSATEFILTGKSDAVFGKGAHRFVLDPSYGAPPRQSAAASPMNTRAVAASGWPRESVLCARFGLRFGRLSGGSDGYCADRTRCAAVRAGEFIYTGPLVIPPTGGKQIYSCNEGNALAWDPAIRDAVDEFKGAKGGKPYALRYVGSMVSDVHRTLCYGGETTATTALAACFCLLA